MGAIGIDLGSYKCVMGVVKRRGIDIVLNDSTSRSTPVLIAFQRAQERIIGDPVKAQIKRNLKSSFMFPTRFVGLNATCKDQIDIEKKYVTHEVITAENNKLEFEVGQMGKTHRLTME
jgi:molecular chaperone DnaK (HSP70)